uniref:Ig-like domain-containing protein n=1 Tax=Astatotilapia calliptera TaxID=8154 RepID=A0A3P8R3H0_ASTCA
PILSVRKGETATMDCNLGTVTDSDARWYKQTPGGVPQFVLYFYHGSSSPTYGSGKVEMSSYHSFFCFFFPWNILHIFSGSSLPPPVLTVFPPSSAELQSNTASVVCLSSQSVPFADVSWLAAGSPVSSGISTSTAVQRSDQTYQISSSLTIQTSDWNMDKVYTCKVSLVGMGIDKILTIRFLIDSLIDSYF